MAVSTIKATQDTGWVSLNTNAQYRVRNGVCTIRISGASLNTTTTTFGQLPEEYLPVGEMSFFVRSGFTFGQGYVTGAGYVRANMPSAQTNCSGLTTFIVG